MSMATSLLSVNQKVAKQLNAKIIVGGKKKLSSVQNKINDVCGCHDTRGDCYMGRSMPSVPKCRTLSEL
jgi:hypothetical protein